jgi:hypothetical protein
MQVVLVKAAEGNFDRMVDSITGRTIATFNGDPSINVPSDQERAMAEFVVRAVNEAGDDDSDVLP